MKGFTQKRALVLVVSLFVVSCGPAIDDSFTAVKQRAEQGHAQALYLAGRLYYSGLSDMPKNEAKAARLIRKAAEQVHAYSQYQLGEMFFPDSGVLQNYYLAYVWLGGAVANSPFDTFSLKKQKAFGILPQADSYILLPPACVNALRKEEASLSMPSRAITSSPEKNWRVRTSVSFSTKPRTT